MINHSYKLPEDNFIPIESLKSRIIIGETRNVEMKHFLGWKHRLNGKYLKTAPFTISSDGTIYQHFNPKYQSKFWRFHDYNSKNIVILLENEGPLIKDSKNKEFITWLGNIYSGRTNVIEKKWRNYNYWPSYSKEQFDSSIILVKHLLKEFNIPANCISHNTKLNTLNNYEGVLYKSNLERYYTDLNPTWDFELFKTKIEENEG